MTRLCIILTLLLATQLCQAAKSEIRHAQNLKIEYLGNAKLITISNPWRASNGHQFNYLLVPRGEKPPEGYDNATVFHIPSKRPVILISSVLAHIDELALENSLTAVGAIKYVNSTDIIKEFAKGNIAEAFGGNEVNVEIVASLDPDLVIASSLGKPESDEHPRLTRVGIPVAVSASYMENSPLGRAEWIKFTAAFFNKEAEAEAVFSKIEKNYQRIAAIAQKTNKRPRILMNGPWSGIWHVPGGQSYSARLLRDAGSDYIWKDVPTIGSIPMDFEIIYSEAVNADIWLNPGTRFDDVQTLAKADSRYQDFKAIKEKQIYSFTKTMIKNGGNDFWERGALHIDEVLTDLIKIFHPELFPDYETIYYKHLKASDE